VCFESISNATSIARNYFNLFDGTSKSLIEHRDVIDSVIDEKIKFVTPKGEINHIQFIERIRALLDNGTKVEVLEMNIHDLGVEYRIRKIIPGQEKLEFHSIGVVEAGKLVRVVPFSYIESHDKFFLKNQEEYSTEEVVGV
jgi:hypothetical protein